MTDEYSETRQLQAAESPAERRRLLADLLTKHQDRLRLMVRLRLDRRLQGRIDSSDVLQETYIEASQRLDEYLADPTAPVFVWLYFLAGQRLQTLHRHHLGARMRDARREISLYRGTMPEATSEALAAQLLGEDTSPSEAAMRAERKIRLQEALNSLEPMDREILALRNFEQLSGPEAARVLGIQESAARKRYLRALKRLKEHLQRMPGGLE